MRTATEGSSHPDSGPEVTIAMARAGEILKVESPDSRPVTLVVLPPQQPGQGASPARALKDPNTFPRLLVAGVVAAVVAGIFGLGQKAMDAPTVNERSECAVAIHNVRVVLDDGVRDPVPPTCLSIGETRVSGGRFLKAPLFARAHAEVWPPRYAQLQR